MSLWVAILIFQRLLFVTFFEKSSHYFTPLVW